MSFQCPVCNGYAPLNASCPECGSEMIDQGIWQNYFDDYSPYLDIDGMKQVNGFPDLREHQCIHYATCATCQHEQLIAVQEINV
ncbi:MAG: hypothetical protein H0Z33_07825 [Bacillaceae bacterium]|nr:hypothetical protein [Bacillaceae bacterium]